MNLTNYQKAIHKTYKDKGWSDKEKTFGEEIALVHSELSEALEEHRDGRGYNEIYFNDDKPGKPEGIPIELADVVIRVLNICNERGIDIEKALIMKAEFNDTRPYRHGKKV